ncbi:MAG: exosortase Y-associated Wzy-like protein [Mucilaginibacter sp.]
MNDKKPLIVYTILYVPWLLSFAFYDSPIFSYLIAWFGSFFIFYISLTGKLKPIPTDRPLAEQLMRPLFLMQIIFAGYMCCTSIFYFFSVLGYEDFEKANSLFIVDQEKLRLTAQCQRYYCLGHASLVTGILVFMKYPVKKYYQIETDKLANLLLIFAFIIFLVSLVFLNYEPLYQFYVQLSSLSFIAGTLALAFAIPLRKISNTLVCLALYVFNFYQAFISGYKEPIIISVVVLGIFLYPNYKKLVTVIGIPLLVALFIFLPAYVSSFRQVAWSGEAGADDASKTALDATLNGDKTESNWSFLVYRLSEIDMFTIFVQSTPNHIDYYGTKILEQSATAIIPRAFWPSKASTESLIMERVYNAGVIFRGSNVSAKPAFIVDAYLSYGNLGIIFFLFAYGAFAQVISIKAEELFGGYILGTALIFSGLFQSFWRGLSMEFLVNTIFWSYITMLIVFRIMKGLKILHPA